MLDHIRYQSKAVKVRIEAFCVYRPFAKSFAWFAIVAGLWAWGAFLPPDFEWFDALGLPDGLRIFNFGALCWYLFTATENGVTFLLLLGIFGGRDPLGPFVGGGPRRPVRGS